MYVVLSKTGCIFCERAIKLLEEFQKDFSVHVLNSHDSSYATELEHMREKYNVPDTFATFPMIIHPNGTFIGGFDDLNKRLSQEPLSFSNDF